MVSNVLFGGGASFPTGWRIKEARYIFVGVAKEQDMVLVDPRLKRLRYADLRSQG
jgi:hypothetical protein